MTGSILASAKCFKCAIGGLGCCTGLCVYTVLMVAAAGLEDYSSIFLLLHAPLCERADSAAAGLIRYCLDV
eukprot:SAG31_NODE_8321_length_1475_cov_1.000727_1_plen_71_part_10